MSQSSGQIKERPQPAPSIHNRLAPTYDYSGFRRFHQHSISDLSSPGSNDSSPTTTISTVDDSSATEPSPGSSPESPPPPGTFAAGMLRPRTTDDGQPFFELQKQPPPKKGRNLKNLAVNTSRTPGRPYSSVSMPLPTSTAEAFPAGSAPAFVKPLTPSNRKPSSLGLTLLTPGTGKAPSSETRLAIPPTPGLARPGMLRHFQSSPSLPLFTNIDTRNGDRPPSLQTNLDTILSPTLSDPSHLDDHEERDFDVPLSKEEKPEAYPDGPISVYAPYIDLYLEPTVEQAREYDVIMNVASEVTNPFDETTASTAEEPEIRIDGGGGIQHAPKRERLPQKRADTVVQIDGLSSAPGTATLEDVTSTTEDERPTKDPEYVHVKWEHNSDIVPDLMNLVKLIDDRVMQGKRVLIHCQCGVSRSASLVVAYGLYKDPSLSVQEAYDTVKKRSKWIGPNMNLIMQLQEFRTSLMHGGLLASNRGMTPITPSSALSEWRGPFASAPTTTSSQMTVQPPLRASTPDQLPVQISGPSSAPSGVTTTPINPISSQRLRAVSASKPATAYVNPSGRLIPVVPVVKVDEVDTPPAAVLAESPTQVVQQEPKSMTSSETLQSPSTEEFAMTPLQPSPDVDPADSFGLMSPSTTEFSSSPFDRSALLAQLGMGSVGHQEDLGPRRSISLRVKRAAFRKDTQHPAEDVHASHRMRGKVSTPNLREQRQLQDLQARIQTSFPSRASSSSQVDEAAAPLMSPRAVEFTQNPFALAVAPPTPSPDTAQTQTSESDPRSPPLKGGSPIMRSIFDVL